MPKRYYQIFNSVLKDPNGVKMPSPIISNFDRCLLYVDSMLKSAVLLCKEKQFTQALFLAITAVEEVVKAEIYCFRSKTIEIPTKPTKDCLKKHEIKYKAAVNKELLLIGERVQNIIGKELTKEIYDNFEKGKIRILREKCLYFDIKEQSLVIPTDVISSKTALSYILACIEIIDDRMVGWTNYSIELSHCFDKYFHVISGLYEIYSC